MEELTMLELRNNVDEVMHRTKQFYGSSKKGSALIQVRSIKGIGSKKRRPLNEYCFPEDLYGYLDANIEGFLNYWKERAELDDDVIPSMQPWFGIAEHSAYIGGKVDFSENTSWHHPLLNNFDDMDKLSLDENNPWFRMVIDGLSYLKEKLNGAAAVKLRGANCPMDIANSLRGNEIFTDFYDEPERCHQLLEFCTKAADWTLSNQLKVTGDFYGGVISGFDVWLPGYSVGHLAEDTSTMCSTQIYNEFGRPYTEKLLSKYDQAFMHTHALGKHNIPSIASIDKIRFIEISSDPNRPRAIEIYKELSECLKNKVVIVQLTLEEIKNNLEFLKDKNTIIWYEAGDVEEAKYAVDFVRKELDI